MSGPTFIMFDDSDITIRYVKADGTHQAVRVNVHKGDITFWSISGTLLKEAAHFEIQNHPDISPTIAKLVGGFTP